MATQTTETHREITGRAEFCHQAEGGCEAPCGYSVGNVGGAHYSCGSDEPKTKLRCYACGQPVCANEYCSKITTSKGVEDKVRVCGDCQELAERDVVWAFWRYDLFPFVLSGVAKSVDERGVADVESYGHRFQTAFTIRGREGRQLHEDLNELRAEHQAAVSELNDDFGRRRDNLLAFRVPAGVEV